MALTNDEKAKVINNDPTLPDDFRDIFALGMVAHSSQKLADYNSVTEASLTPAQRSMVNLSKEILNDSQKHLDAFIRRFANDSNVTWGTLVAKIPDVIPAIFPDMCGIIEFDRQNL